MLTERKENIPPRAETPEVPFGAKLGVYEQRRRKLQEERNKEYNQFKSEVRLTDLLHLTKMIAIIHMRILIFLIIHRCSADLGNI